MDVFKIVRPFCYCCFCHVKGIPVSLSNGFQKQGRLSKLETEESDSDLNLKYVGSIARCRRRVNLAGVTTCRSRGCGRESSLQLVNM